jgi:hypothetical protein
MPSQLRAEWLLGRLRALAGAGLAIWPFLWDSDLQRRWQSIFFSEPSPTFDFAFN